LSKGTYGSETVALAERLSIEYELRNGTGAFTSPELNELREDGFLSKASRKRKHTFTEKEITVIMGQQPKPTETTISLDSVTCTCVKFRD